MSTNEDLIKKINEINNNFYKNIIKVALSNNIDYIKYCNNDSLEYSSDTEFIKWKSLFLLKERGVYIGIVEGGSSDIHVVLKPEYRKKSNMVYELNNTIIPFLMKDGENQKFTFINNKVKSYFMSLLDGIEDYDDGAIIYNKNKKDFKSNIENKFTLKEFDEIKVKMIKLAKISDVLYKSSKKRNEVYEMMRETYVSEDDCKYILKKYGFKMSNWEANLYKKYINYFKKNKNYHIDNIAFKYNKVSTTLIEDLFFWDYFEESEKKINHLTLLSFYNKLSKFN